MVYNKLLYIYIYIYIHLILLCIYCFIWKYVHRSIRVQAWKLTMHHWRIWPVGWRRPRHRRSWPIPCAATCLDWSCVTASPFPPPSPIWPWWASHHEPCSSSLSSLLSLPVSCWDTMLSWPELRERKEEASWRQMPSLRIKPSKLFLWHQRLLTYIRVNAI